MSKPFLKNELPFDQADYRCPQCRKSWRLREDFVDHTMYIHGLVKRKGYSYPYWLRVPDSFSQTRYRIAGAENYPGYIAPIFGGLTSEGKAQVADQMPVILPATGRGPRSLHKNNARAANPKPKSSKKPVKASQHAHPTTSLSNTTKTPKSSAKPSASPATTTSRAALPTQRSSTLARVPMVHTRVIDTTALPFVQSEQTQENMDHLLPYLALGFIPQETSGDGNLCAIYALEISLHAIRELNFLRKEENNVHYTAKHLKNMLKSKEYKQEVDAVLAEMAPGAEGDVLEALRQQFSPEEMLGMDQIWILVRLLNREMGTSYNVGCVTQGYRGAYTIGGLRVQANALREEQAQIQKNLEVANKRTTERRRKEEEKKQRQPQEEQAPTQRITKQISSTPQKFQLSAGLEEAFDGLVKGLQVDVQALSKRENFHAKTVASLKDHPIEIDIERIRVKLLYQSQAVRQTTIAFLESQRVVMDNLLLIDRDLKRLRTKQEAAEKKNKAYIEQIIKANASGDFLLPGIKASGGQDKEEREQRVVTATNPFTTKDAFNPKNLVAPKNPVAAKNHFATNPFATTAQSGNENAEEDDGEERLLATIKNPFAPEASLAQPAKPSTPRTGNAGGDAEIPDSPTEQGAFGDLKVKVLKWDSEYLAPHAINLQMDDPRAPTIWLYFNNMETIYADQYNELGIISHWEGMSPATSINGNQTVQTWNLNQAITDDTSNGVWRLRKSVKHPDMPKSEKFYEVRQGHFLRPVADPPDTEDPAANHKGETFLRTCGNRFQRWFKNGLLDRVQIPDNFVIYQILETTGPSLDRMQHYEIPIPYMAGDFLLHAGAVPRIPGRSRMRRLDNVSSGNEIIDERELRVLDTPWGLGRRLDVKGSGAQLPFAKINENAYVRGELKYEKGDVVLVVRGPNPESGGNEEEGRKMRDYAQILDVHGEVGYLKARSYALVQNAFGFALDQESLDAILGDLGVDENENSGGAGGEEGCDVDGRENGEGKETGMKRAVDDGEEGDEIHIPVAKKVKPLGWTA